MPNRRKVSADGDLSIAAGKTVKGDIRLTHITNLTEKETYPGLSVSPPADLLPTVLRGREELCAGISSLISNYLSDRNESTSLLLAGLGGVGKSAIALYACKQALNAGVETFWVDASAGAPVVPSMWRIAQELNEHVADFPQAPTEAGTIDLVWRALETTSKPWLIVFDNADDPTALAANGFSLSAGNGWVRFSANGLVVVTSRFADSTFWPRGFQSVLVEPLTSQSGATLLLDLAGSPQTTKMAEEKQIRDATALSERLGGLPLALRAAGIYISRKGYTASSSFADYTQALDSHFSTLLGANHNPGERTGSNKNRDSVLVTWSLSIEYLASNGFIDALRLIRFISCLDPTHIPVSLLAQIDSIFLDASSDEDTLIETLREMQILGLVERVDEETIVEEGLHSNITIDSTIQVHRLVAEVFGLALIREEQEARKFFRATVKALAGALKELEEIEGWAVLDQSFVTVHCVRVARSILHYPSLYARNDIKGLVNVISRVCDKMMSGSLPSTSVASLTVFLSLAESVFLRNSKPVRKIKHRLAHHVWHLDQRTGLELLIGSQNRWLRFNSRISPVFRSVLPASHDLVVTDDVKSEQAEWSLFALHIFRRVPWRSSKNMLINRTRIASSLTQSGHNAEAVAELRSVVKTYARKNQRETYEALDAQLVLAGAIHTSEKLPQPEDFAVAETEYRQILEINDRIRPEADQTRRARHDLAAMLQQQSRLAEAEAEYRTALQLLEQAHAGHGWHAAHLIHHVAAVLLMQGRSEMAEAEYRKALSLMDELSGGDTQEALIVRLQLAGLLRKRGKLDAAEAEYRRVVAAGDPGQPGSSETVQARQELSNILRERSKRRSGKGKGKPRPTR